MLTQQYIDYLMSDAWWKLRQLIMRRAGRRCEIDGCCRKASEVHHLTYRRIFREDPNDLLAVCRVHHQQLHVVEVQPRKSVAMGPTLTIKEQLDLFAAGANDNVPKKLEKQA